MKEFQQPTVCRRRGLSLCQFDLRSTMLQIIKQRQNKYPKKTLRNYYICHCVRKQLTFFASRDSYQRHEQRSVDYIKNKRKWNA